MRFEETKVTKEKFYAAKKTIKVWDVNVDNIVILKLVKTKTNTKYFIGYSEKAIRPLDLILHKMSRYDQTFKLKMKVKIKINRLISFFIHDEKLLLKYKDVWTKIEDLKNTKLDALFVYDNRYIKTKIRANGDKVYTNFGDLNVPEDDIEHESFPVTSIDSLLSYKNKYYLQVYLVIISICAYKIANKQMTDFLDEIFLKIR